MQRSPEPYDPLDPRPRETLVVCVADPGPQVPILEAFTREVRRLANQGREVSVVAVPYCDSYSEWRAHVTVGREFQEWVWRRDSWAAE